MAEDDTFSPAQQVQAMPIRDKNGSSSQRPATANDRNITEANDDGVDASQNQLNQVKHPLQHPWTLWYYRNDRSKLWEDNLQEVVTFDTVEDFWAMYNHIEVASKLGPSCDYCVFKQGIKPMWEDPNNVNGGRWLIQLDKKYRQHHLDRAWLEILLCMIGESFDDDGHIVNGAVVNIRNRGDKIGIWLGNSKLEASIMHVGQVLKKRLGLSSEIRLAFEAHEDTMQKAGSTAKSKYLL